MSPRLPWSLPFNSPGWPQTGHHPSACLPHIGIPSMSHYMPETQWFFKKNLNFQVNKWASESRELPFKLPVGCQREAHQCALWLLGFSMMCSYTHFLLEADHSLSPLLGAGQPPLSPEPFLSRWNAGFHHMSFPLFYPCAVKSPPPNCRTPGKFVLLSQDTLCVLWAYNHFILVLLTTPDSKDLMRKFRFSASQNTAAATFSPATNSSH